jgi:hypothetical protein
MLIRRLMSAFVFQLGFCLLFALSPGEAAAPTSSQSGDSASVQGPAALNFDELTELAANDPPPAPLGEKLDRLLSTPFISNEAGARKAIPNAPKISGLGPVLRIAEWNINRGENEHEVKLALSDSKGFLAVAQHNPSLKTGSLSHLAEELHELAGADVLVLDEVDKGVNRTKYHDVARNLATALNMNYVYATEFIELDRIYLGIKNMDAVERPWPGDRRPERQVAKRRAARDPRPRLRRPLASGAPERRPLQTASIGGPRS